MLDSTDKSTRPSNDEPRKYPKSIAFIISNEFCERFNYYGMRTILVLYMTIKLGYSDDAATVLFHIFTALVYLFPIFGAIIADSFLGKFKTILYLSCVYASGSILIAIGAIPTLNLPATTLTVVGLLLIGLGSGGIKPCVSAFGGDQFRVEQAKQLATFFSSFYFAINAGSLISTYLTPILRKDVHCFGDLDCFSLAFWVPGVLMVISIFVFVAGRSMYVIKKPTGNVIVQVVRCVMNAVSEKSKSLQKLPHWLDHSEEKFGRPLVDDIKSVLKILLLFLPLPLFWALFDQQGSRWTFQATRMDGEIWGFNIKPDQMQVVNPLLILIFIPIFDCAIYPFLAKIGLKTPLQKLASGGILAAIAFLVSGLIEIQLEQTYPVLPRPNESQVRIFNGYSCNYSLSSDIVGINTQQLNSLEISSFNVKLESSIMKSFKLDPLTPECPKAMHENLTLSPGKSNSFFLMNKNSALSVLSFEDKIEKSRSGDPILRVLINSNSTKNIIFYDRNGVKTKEVSTSPPSFEQFEIIPSTYTVFADDLKLGKVELSLGGVYAIIVSNVSTGNIEFKTHVITAPNSLHMLWLLPQYVIMTAGEVMFSVTGLEFAYSQAPSSMKSLLQACWLLTVAFGNVIVVIIAEAKFFQSQAHEFFLFAALMIVDMAVFGLIARRYEYVINVPVNGENNELESATPNFNPSGVESNSKQSFSNTGFQEE